MIQKNLGLSYAYTGFLVGNTIILMSCFSHEHHDISSYMIQVLLKVLLGILILPIFRYGITYIFQVKDQRAPNLKDENLHLGYGIYFGMTYITSALLATIIIGQIHFGTIYPFF